MKRRREKQQYVPGLAPGTIRERSADQAIPVEISILDYDRGSFEIRESAPIEEIAQARPGINRWIRVRGTPTAELIRRIGESFGAHNLILEDIISSGQRIKVEDYDNLMFTVLRTPRESGPLSHDEEELSVILTGTTLITVYESDDAAFFAPILARLGNADSLLRHHRVDFLFHAIVDLVVDGFFPAVRRLEDAASDLETGILEHASEEQLRSIHLLRSAAGTLRQTMWSTRDVISRVERSTHRFIEQETLFYFRDISDHVVHLLDAVSMLRDSANALMELYMSGVSNRMNEVMKVLTIISTIFIPGTFIAGVYGMNFAHMPELQVRWAYPVVLGVMAVVAVGMVVFFRRRRWF